MKRVPEQPDRENRITFEIVVDAYDETERAMGWYYYLQDKLQVPFKAKCRSVRATSPLEVGAKVEVVDTENYGTIDGEWMLAQSATIARWANFHFPSRRSYLSKYRPPTSTSNGPFVRSNSEHLIVVYSMSLFSIIF